MRVWISPIGTVGSVGSTLGKAFEEAEHELCGGESAEATTREQLEAADVAVLVLTDERLQHVASLVENLRDVGLSAEKEKVVVLVSSTMTWSDHPPPAPAPAPSAPTPAPDAGAAPAADADGSAVEAAPAEEEATAPAEAEAEAVEGEGAPVEVVGGESEAAAAAEEESAPAAPLLHESAFASRRSNTRYAAWRTLESVLLRAAAAPGSGLRAVVVGAGATYGRGGGDFGDILAHAWAQPHVPLTLRAALGAHSPPLIHVTDLARTVVKAAETAAAAAAMTDGTVETKGGDFDAVECPNYIVAVDESTVTFRSAAAAMVAALGGSGFGGVAAAAGSADAEAASAEGAAAKDAAAQGAASEGAAAEEEELTEMARLALALEPTPAYAVDSGPLLSHASFDRAGSFAASLDGDDGAWVSLQGPVAADVAAEFLASRGALFFSLLPCSFVCSSLLCSSLQACARSACASAASARACCARNSPRSTAWRTSCRAPRRRAARREWEATRSTPPPRCAGASPNRTARTGATCSTSTAPTWKGRVASRRRRRRARTLRRTLRQALGRTL
jgi:hypothetical protein